MSDTPDIDDFEDMVIEPLPALDYAALMAERTASIEDVIPIMTEEEQVKARGKWLKSLPPAARERWADHASARPPVVVPPVPPRRINTAHAHPDDMLPEVVRPDRGSGVMP